MRTTFATLARHGAAVLALAAVLAGSAHASGVLYSQAPTAGAEPYPSSDIPGVGSFQQADSFKLGGAASVSGFNWYGSDILAGQFVVRLFSDLVGSPDTFTTLAGSITQTARSALDGSQAIFEYDMTLNAPISVLGGKDYYLSVLSVGSVWGWLESSQGDTVSAFRDIDGNPWNILAPDMSLVVIGDRLGGTVPEPSTLAMVAFALAASAAATRRRRA
jgi:hypothetical protein